MPPSTATMATVAGGSGGRRSRSKQHVMVYKVVNSRNKEDMAAVRVLLVLTTEKDHIQIEYLPVRRKAVENRPRNSRRWVAVLLRQQRLAKKTCNKEGCSLVLWSREGWHDERKVVVVDSGQDARAREERWRWNSRRFLGFGSSSMKSRRKEWPLIWIKSKS